MDDQQQRIQEDLQGLLQGDVLFDPLTLALYSNDSSLFQIHPLGVVLPRNRQDVITVVQYAQQQQIPIIPRGSGTGMAGESLGNGLILDFSRYMRRIISVSDDWVRVQPGVVCEQINSYLRRFGRQFAPDPAGADCTTIGSMVAINAAGSRSLRYGSTRDHLRHIEAVLANGMIMDAWDPKFQSMAHTARKPVPANFRTNQNHDASYHDGDNGIHTDNSELSHQLISLLRQNKKLIDRCQPRSRRDRSGFLLKGVLEQDRLDLTKLLCGSEGTLSIFTELTLTTVAIPQHRAALLLLFDHLESAAMAVMEVLEGSPSACDLLDRRLLALARESDPTLEAFIPPATEAALIVELDGQDDHEVREKVKLVINRLRLADRSPFQIHEAFKDDLIERFWKLPRTVVPMLYRMKGTARPVPFIEDIAIPPEELPAFLLTLQNLLKRHHVTASLFAHAGDGQLHCRPFLNPHLSTEVQRLRDLAQELYSKVLEVGGSISGEHAEGLSRTPYTRDQNRELYPIFKEVKRLFDPYNILNPGKIISEHADTIIRHLRPTSVSVKTIPLKLKWEDTSILDTARRCNGCGGCRTHEQTERMCPIFRIAPDEKASPRAKANLVRHLFEGKLENISWGSNAFKQIADLCINCKQCRLECPANVDIPKMMLEAKSAHVAENGISRHDWALSRIDLLASWGSKTSLITNRLLQNPSFRWILEKAIGVHRRRKVPRFTSRPFLKRAAQVRLTESSPSRQNPKVAYFVDTYANYCDPRIAESLISVFQHNDIAVHVPPDQWSSGMPLFSIGDLDTAKPIAKHNVQVLADLVRDGYTIICSEPSATVCLTEEYPNYLVDPEVHLVSKHTVDACHYLWQRHLEGQLRLDFNPLPLKASYHIPCHLKALQTGNSTANLLRLIPGLSAPTIEKGCSGMAGMFGYKKDSYRTSLKAGWNLVSHMRDTRQDLGVTECSTCKIQMEQGTSTSTQHPLKILALAYGILPELEREFQTSSKKLVVT